MEENTAFNDVTQTTDYQYTYHEYDIYMYPGYSFERPIYLFIWEILVVFVSLVNLIVIIVLLRRGMRNPTNMILAAIAISDSMTGLVTLPTYIMVYNNFEAAPTPEDMAIMDKEMTEAITSVAPSAQSTAFKTMTTVMTTFINVTSGDGNSTATGFTNDIGINLSSTVSYAVDGTTHEFEYAVQEGYVLTKELCASFMISKFFLSKFFHTISIFLTLFLGFQRFVSVAYPFRAQSFFTIRNTVIVCVVIFLISPILHVYHLQDEKTLEGLCEWRLENCTGDCAFLWIILLVRHFIPCTLLTVFTVLFILELRKGRMEMNQEQSRRRAEENRRVSIIVVAIVVVFLVPEIPYGFFLLSSVISKHAQLPFDLEKNRAIHAAYEILLVLSFHANFYIYTFLNKRFRTGLKRTFLYPIRKAMGRPISWLPSRSHSSRSLGTRRTMNSEVNSKTATEMNLVRKNTETSDLGRSTLDRNNCRLELKPLNDRNSD